MRRRLVSFHDIDLVTAPVQGKCLGFHIPEEVIIFAVRAEDAPRPGEGRCFPVERIIHDLVDEITGEIIGAPQRNSKPPPEVRRMHEVSLMRNLLAVVEDAAARDGGGAVRTIHLRIGELSGVSVDALRFAFEVLSSGTVAEGGTLECDIVPLSVQCKDCGEEFHPRELVFRCPACGSAVIDIRAGREMEVDYIEIDD